MLATTVRPITDLDACRHSQEVHRRIWQLGDEEIVPVHTLITVARNGGLLLGAYAYDGPPETGGMVGFAFGWLGTVDADPARSGPPALKMCSHIVGVLPEWQRRGVGLQLKLAQRQQTLEQGVTDRMTWTYDPLLRRNAAFNLRRLGAVSNTYKRNIYGKMNDALNAGLPTDRCQVDWFLRSERVECAAAGEPEIVDWKRVTLQRLATRSGPVGFRMPGTDRLQPDQRPLAVPLPADLNALRDHDPTLALEWRYFLREVLESAFAAGYLMVDCCEIANHGWHYVLMPSS